MDLRYLGFDQQGTGRAFRFEIAKKGFATRNAVVTAEMSLFRTFHVAIQDGPTLCAGKLAADLENKVEGGHSLTADDLRAHSAILEAAEIRRMDARALAGRRHHAPSTATGDPRRRP